MADVVKYRFVLRRGLKADWTAKNEILLQGEFGLELDTGKLKIGDGTTAWNTLAYFAAGDVGGVTALSGTSHTLALVDANKTLISGSSSAFALSIPLNATIPFDIGTKIAYTQGAAGALTVSAVSGVTLHAPNGAATGRQYDGGVIEKIGTDEWQIWNGAALAAVATSGDYNDLINKPVPDSITAMNEQTGTTYTLVAADGTKAVRCTNAAAIALTIPLNSTAALPLYRPLPVFQGGVGVITVSGASGVTLESPNGAATTNIGDFRVLFQRAANIWVIG